MRNSSKYITTKEFVKCYRISFIILMNVVWALAKVKGMTDQSKRLVVDLKEVFQKLYFSIGTRL
jgi:hypothetical protein